MLFITAQQLPSFVIWDTTSRSWLPRLKPRQVPISQWLVLVTTFVSGTLLNNLVFAFNVPLTVQIIFRSAGACASLSLLFLFLVRAELTRLSGWSAGCRSSRVHGPRPRLHGEAIHAPTNCTALPLPLFGASTTPADGSLFTLYKTAVAVVSSGVVIATLSRPRADSSAQPSSSSSSTPAADTSRYAIGVAMLLTSLVCTGVHGALQERTYSTYGPHWREGVFYMVCNFPPIIIIIIRR